jgi:NADH-quinone oxidoreductase subunit N
MSEMGIKAIIFYLSVYLLMNLGAFLVVIMLENKGVSAEIPLYRGMGGRAPMVAVAMGIFLFSLTGLPPFAGFVGKVYLFAGLINSKIYWLAVVGVLNSVVSLYYYARIVKVMFFEKSEEIGIIKADLPLYIIMWCLAVPTVLLGLYWEPLMNLAQRATEKLGM